ncbi:MAG: hypothetical protein HC810_05270 [Acaryochloridaceae cyanobacterium RL_2_7]|nr:hypothetical protein [Acaryochloridaceae cyanobacterium RL_2_7]
MWKLYEQVKAWKEQPHPTPPPEEEGPQLQQQVSAYRQRIQVLDLTMQRQRKDLEELGEPRSLFKLEGADFG